MSNDEENGTTPFPFHWLEGDSLAPPCHSENDVIEPMLDMLSSYLNQNSTFMDLGCGDGRVCIAATQRFGCFSIGVEIEEHLVAEFKSQVSLLSLQSKISIVHGDLCNIDFEQSNVISLYLLPEAIELIKDKLICALSKGSIVVCNSWGIRGILPQKVVTAGFCNNVNIFLYTKKSIE